MHLRTTAHGVGHLGLCHKTCGSLRFQTGGGPSRAASENGAPPPPAPGADAACGSRCRRPWWSPFSTSRVSAAMMSACLAMARALSTASAPRDVIIWVPFIRARPSLGLSDIGFSP
uniref:Uncharacterized protein n=1 Tax=Anguilla anguilla TaxID=7936 RepID=A0A0E9QN58_ANGAN